MTRSKSLFSKIIAPVAALVLSLGIAAGAGVGLTANAAELQEDPVSGWYVVGNGAGELSGCSWQEYRADWRLTGTAEDAENYAGVWHTDEILLYQGDQFKIVYNDGTWTHPDESGWTADNCAQFENIEDTKNDFSDGGLGNIYAEVSGYYTFTLNVVVDPETGLSTLTLSFVRSDTEVPPLVLYDMYIVGSIASVETCGWPDNLVPAGPEGVELYCIKMTSATEGEGQEKVTTWSATVVLGLEDQFKLYNTVTGTYYPGGFDNNLMVEEAGTYLVSWVEGSQDVTLTLQTPVEG